MRLSFVATEAGFEADEYALICGVSGEGQYLTFQRDAEDSGEGWGIHLEYGDQANGGYGCVAGCRLAGNAMTVDLARPLGRLTGVTGFDVTLDIGPESLASLRTGLQRVFRGHADTLYIE
jgi:hypothetical protein